MPSEKQPGVFFKHITRQLTNKYKKKKPHKFEEILSDFEGFLSSPFTLYFPFK